MLLTLLPQTMTAQNTDARNKAENPTVFTDKTSGNIPTNIPTPQKCSLPTESCPQPLSRRSYIGMNKSEQDSLNLPILNMRGQTTIMTYPYDTWWGIDSWQLHKGLNMNLGASVFAAFGKGEPKGAGFGQDLSLMYALPLTNKLSLAVGGWLSNVYWAHDRYTDAGINAILGYRFDEHWEAYVYGRKSVINKPVPYHFRSMQELGDRIGAAVKYNFSPSFSVQVSVSAGKYKAPDIYDDF